MGSWFSSENQPQGSVSIDDLPDGDSQLTCSINELSDNDLQSIIKHLPPFDRLVVSEICHRWYGISRIPWSDVACIDSTSIPVGNLAAIIRQCPNLRSVIVVRAYLNCKALQLLSHLPLLSSVKLYGIIVSIPKLGLESVDLFTALFSENLSNTSWQELVLHDACADVSGTLQNGLLAGALPLTLERLQISGVRAIGPIQLWRLFAPPYSELEFLGGLGRLENLTCLILCRSTRETCLVQVALNQPQTYREIEKLKNLRELWIGFCDIGMLPFLPQLQVLFLTNITNNSAEDLTRLATSHSSLRILFITGYFDQERTIPVRRLYPNGFGSDPLPLLHVFLDRKPSEMFRFTKSSATALKVYPISAALPTFLESEEIAPIFEGVWIAAQVKEGAKHGATLCDCGYPPATSVRFVGDDLTEQ